MSTSLPNHDNSNSSRTQRVVSLRSFLPEAVFVGARDIEVRRCANRANKCKPGDVFVPDHHAGRDEADLADEAVRRGAVAVVTERILPISVPQCLVEDTRIVYGRLCQALVGQPSQRMLTVGIIGSHGKTTTSLFVAMMLKKMAGAVAYYTSLGCSDSQKTDRLATRPPGATKLANWMRQADLAGSPAAVIEVNSAMLASRATSGIEFDMIIVTGLRSSQLRNSPSHEQLQQWTRQSIENLKPHGVVLVNGDDASAAAFADSLDTPVAVYGIDAGKQVRGKRLSRHGGQQQILVVAGNTMMPLTLAMPGDHVARAALAAVATSWIVDLPIPETVSAVESLDTIPGRMQRITQAVDVPLYIDAGQTPDRVAVALHALRSHNFGPATVVMDLGNELDSSWRQRLGEVLDKGAKSIVLSASDLSPEAAQRVAMDVLGGCQKPGRVHVIPDREAAIRWAVRHTHQGCILLCGCGASSWTDRDGQPVSDEMIAKQAVSQANQVAAVQKLAIFPPSSQSEFFSH